MYGTPALQVLAKKLNLNMYQNWIEGNYIHWSIYSLIQIWLSYDMVGLPILSVVKLLDMYLP